MITKDFEESLDTTGCLRGLDTQRSRMLIDILFLEMADSLNLRVMCPPHNHGARKNVTMASYG